MGGLRVYVQASSNKVRVKWEFPDPGGISICRLNLSCDDVGEIKEKFVESNPNKNSYTFRNLEPGFLFTLVVSLLIQTDGGEDVVCASKSVRFKTIDSKDELEKSYKRIVAFNQTLAQRKEYCYGKAVEEFEFFTRVKPHAYWNEQKKLSPGLLKKRLQSSCGPPSCAINNELDLMGTWFCTHKYKGKLHDKSPFGTVRLLLPAVKYMTNPNKFNVYYAGGRCLATKDDRAHYASLILCRKGSVSDSFGNKHLYRLDIHNNPFLQATKQHDGSWRYYTSTAVYTDVLITEDISYDYAELQTENIKNTAERENNGYAYNPYCPVCFPEIAK